jgi:uncharacterized damage-inducible protein DinB
MSLKERLKQQLTSARAISERILDDFHTPEEWLRQLHPGTNHALWFAGHMGQTDNFFVSLVDPKNAAPREGWGETFGMGSQPTGNPDDYPPVAEVLDYMRDRRQALLTALENLSEEELDTRTPKGTPEFLADYGMVFQAASWHEGMHTGQLTTVRRSLGHVPLMNRSAPAEAT